MSPPRRKGRDMQADANWHLDKRVPVAIIFAIIVQTSGIVWWAGQTSQRMTNVEARLDSSAPQGDRLTRVEVKVDNLIDATTEIKAILRKESAPIKR